MLSKFITLNTSKNSGYHIYKTNNIFDKKNKALLGNHDIIEDNSRRIIIIDKNVLILYGDKLFDYLDTYKIKYKIITVEGEDYNKNDRTLLYILKEMESFDVSRKGEPVIILGGGVVGDVGSFAASIYRRGVPFIKVPTTLMGYVDASVGIKTGINLGDSKNRVGSFSPPLFVALDKQFFKTQDVRNIINGFGEIIKLAIILDEKLFNIIEKTGYKIIEQKLQNESLSLVLDKSISIMANELSNNIYEDDLKRKVDFGHTFSLKIESSSNYEIKHGEAVAIDCLLSSAISTTRGILPIYALERIIMLLKELQFPLYINFSPELMLSSVEERIFHRNGEQLIPVPTSIGNATFLNDITITDIKKALELLRKYI